MTKCETLIEKAKRSLVKKDLSLDTMEAVSLLESIIQSHGARHYARARGFFDRCWYNTDNQDEGLVLYLDCQNLRNIIISIAVVKGKRSSNPLFGTDDIVPPPPALLEVLNGLEGFSKDEHNVWSRSLGAVKSLAQAKRIILPAWEETYNALKPFGDAW